MPRAFFQEDGALPEQVRLVFDAASQDELDRHAAAAAARKRQKARARGEPTVLEPRLEPRRTDSNRPAPSWTSTLDVASVGGRAILAGFAAGAVGFVGIARFGVPFQASLAFGLFAVAIAALSVPGVHALRLRMALRRARATFEICVSPQDLVIRTAKTVIRSWQLATVREVTVERRRLLVESTDRGVRILPIRFASEEEVQSIAKRTRALLAEARAATSATPGSHEAR
jgi:hypothetical protein